MPSYGRIEISIIGGIFMSGEYRHIKQLEKEIFQGMVSFMVADSPYYHCKIYVDTYFDLHYLKSYTAITG